MKLIITIFGPSGRVQEATLSADLELNNPDGIPVLSEESVNTTGYVNLQLNKTAFDLLKSLAINNSTIPLVLKKMKVDKELPDDPKVEAVKKLTRCEFNVLRMLSEGFSYQEIADLIFKSVETIKTQADSVYFKLNIHKGPKVARIYFRFIFKYPLYLFGMDGN